MLQTVHKDCSITSENDFFSSHFYPQTKLSFLAFILQLTGGVKWNPEGISASFINHSSRMGKFIYHPRHLWNMNYEVDSCSNSKQFPGLTLRYFSLNKLLIVAGCFNSPCGVLNGTMCLDSNTNCHLLGHRPSFKLLKTMQRRTLKQWGFPREDISEEADSHICHGCLWTLTCNSDLI